MKKRNHWCALLVGGLLLTATAAQAQRPVLYGKVTDAETNEPLIGVNIASGNRGTTTDLEGNYTLAFDAQGTYEVLFSYTGYDPSRQQVALNGERTELDVAMGGVQSLREVVVTADIAIERKTPVAFSNISTAKLSEELASQDLPMVLNTTPGAYATQGGGGDGDARITIRGFNQRNVAVMLDGIPVNDMENGWVYWSNWFGLDLVTKTMQVQRGLGASKLASPSIGGTINILTKGIEAKGGVRLQSEVGSNGFSRQTVGFTSGRLASGWAISAAVSAKWGDGWVDQTYTRAFFYYLRVDKQIGNHLISFSGFGAPQRHGQRAFTNTIATYDSAYAQSLGVPQDVIAAQFIADKGLRYNEFWGNLNGEPFNSRENYYHKPQLSLRHSWDISPRLFWSNVAYLSIGRGGGTAPNTSVGMFADGQLDLQTAYNANATVSFLNPDQRASNIIRASVNDHLWYGLLSTIRFEANKNWVASGGLDGRFYAGDHYREVIDMLGGKYFRNDNTGNQRIDPATRLTEGDKFAYHNTGFVQWGGAFGLLEYTNGRWSGFVNLSGAATGYKLVDYMKAKVVVLADTTFYLKHGETVRIGDRDYTLDAPEAANQTVDWVWKGSFSFKAGALLQLDSRQNVFFNAGLLSKSQRFSNVINDYRTQPDRPVAAFADADNETIRAVEGGYTYKSPAWSLNFNAYFTYWNNRPLDNAPTVLEDPTDPNSDRIPVNVNGIKARHAGIELDVAYPVLRQLTLEGLASVGDWIWNSAAKATLPDGSTYEFDATGVHVGDAAQLQLGGLVRYEPFEGLYVKAKGTFFAKNYANFSPESLKESTGTARLDSWKMPTYVLFDLHAGYTWKAKWIKLDARLNLLNALDARYIADATNNDAFAQSFNDFDAKSAGGFFGLGRRWAASLTLQF